MKVKEIIKKVRKEAEEIAVVKLLNEKTDIIDILDKVETKCYHSLKNILEKESNNKILEGLLENAIKRTFDEEVGCAIEGAVYLIKKERGILWKETTN